MSPVTKRIITTFFLLVYLLTSQIFSPISVSAIELPSSDKSLYCNIQSLMNLLPFVGLGSNDWYFQDPCNFYDKVYNSPQDEIFGERYTFAQVNWIVNSILAYVPGVNIFIIPIDELVKLLTDFPIKSDSGSTFQHFAHFGPTGAIFGIISEMYRIPPASSVVYFRQIAEKFSFVPPVHAQGYGYTQSTALLSMWEATRNIAYLFMTLCLIVAGFLVIFRVKINPQTAVTIQMLIPRIITTLLLITFSYAIAGFVIDMVYVTLTLAIRVLFGSDLLGGLIIDTFTSGYYLTVFMFLVSIGLIFVGMIFTPLGGPILSLILLVVMLFVVAKVAWILIKSYVNILLAIILGPLQIMMGIIPNIGGSKISVGFGSWLKGLLANAAVFVVVPIMLILVLYFWNPVNLLSTLPVVGDIIDTLSTALTQILNLLPGDIDGGLLGFGGFSGNLPVLPGAVPFGGSFFLVFMMGWGILSLTPKAAEMIRDAIKVSGFKYGTAFGEALAPIGIISAPAGRVASNVASNVAQPYISQASEYISSKMPQIPSPKPREAAKADYGKNT